MKILSSVEKGRPSSKREEAEEKCYDLLDSLGIEYARVDHEAAMTMEDCRLSAELLGTMLCKNLFLTNRQKTKFYLLLMPWDKEFRTKDLSAQIASARLSFAGEELMGELLGVTPGSVSVLGLMNDKEKQVHLLIDSDVLQCEDFACHPCRNTTSIAFPLRDLTDKLLPSLGVEYTEVRL